MITNKIKLQKHLAQLH